MAKYARINPDDTIAEVRNLDGLPPDIPHKGVRWRAVADDQPVDGEFYSRGDFALVNGVVSRPAIARSVGDIRSRMIGKVKALAQSKIMAIMPAHKQANMMALAIENIRAYGSDAEKWPDQMRAIAADADARWEKIKAIRVASDAIEADILAADFAGLEVFDIQKGWPE